MLTLLATRPSVPIAVAMRWKSDAHLWRLGQPIANRRRATSFRLRAVTLTFSRLRPIMPRAKSQIGNWGGRRKGAGRKRRAYTFGQTENCERLFCSQARRSRFGGQRRVATPSFDELSAKYGVTYRMVVRCLEEFLRENRTQRKNVEVRNGGGRNTAASGRRKRNQETEAGHICRQKAAP